MASPEVLEAIQVLQMQQRESMERMDALRAQHRDWQQAMQGLMASLAREPRGAVQPPQVQGDASEVLEVEASELDLDAVSPRSSDADTWRKSSKGKKTTLKLDKTPARMQKLVNEVLLDHHEEGGPEVGTWWQERRRALYRFVNSSTFEYITSVVIMLNLVLIGVEAELSITQGVVEWATEVERVLLVIYTLEVLLRLLAKGPGLFYNRWFLLDVFLVCVGLLGLVVIPLLGGNRVDVFDKVLVVRGLRLLRLARALRMVGYFKVIWRLVYGILTAGNTMVSTCCLLMLCVFIFGCVAVEIITKDQDLQRGVQVPETELIVRQNFGSLSRAILTLCQFVTLDSIAEIYFPLIMAKPYLVIFFMPLFLFLSLGLMNLVTAVLVEHALEHAAHEHDAERLKTKQKIKAALPALLDIFHRLDADESGCITRQEIEGVPLDMLPPKLLDNVSVDSMGDLFELLDVDGGGSLTQAEFVEGLLNLVLLDVPIWTIQSLKLLRLIRGMTMEINEQLKRIQP